MLLIAALFVAACGGGDSAEGPAEDTDGSTADGGTEAEGTGTDGTGAEGPGTEGSEPAAPEASPADGAQAAGDCSLEEPVPVGVVFSQTGGAAVYGATQLNGAQLAADQQNAQGGVTYELVVEDDASEPAQGITAFEQLINAGEVSVIIGPTLSNTAFSTDPIAQDAGVPVLGVSNTAEGVTEIGDFIFRDSLTEQQVIPQTVAAAKDEFGLERVAVLYGDDDAFTQSGYEVFAQALGESDIEVATTQTFAKGDTDFSAQLTEARGADPDALVVSALAEEAALILTQAADLGLDVPVVGGNGFNSPALAENAGEAAEGTVVGAAWNSAAQNPQTEEFISAYQEAYGSAPDQFAAQAYAGMNIVAEAVETACSADRDAIRDAMSQISGLPTVLGEFSFTENRDADHPAVVQIVRDGEFQVLAQ
jgi:branched-chain amino acid transport system substrate-binding protein